ncbi:MAG: cobalamin B12-binding domain-containing protein [Nitrospirae bacterium]|nr:cobalamin B12-binding domain-containing protein [Nitrospirota bacterium]
MAKKPQLDLLLIHPGNRQRIYQVLGRKLSSVEPPVWAGLMATYVRRKGYSVSLIDTEAEGLSPEQAAGAVADAAPLLVAIVVYGHQPSASTQNMSEALDLAAAIKQRTPEQKLLLVGGHVAALPEQTLKDSAADFVSSGEGPATLSSLLEALKSVSPNLGKVAGLLYRDNAELRWGPPSPLIQELDAEMPGIAWDLLPMKKYRAHNWHALGHPSRQPYASVYTTLGCPYHCTFCCIQAPFKSGEKFLGYKDSTNTYRYWSPKTVVDQLELLAKDYGVQHVKFADEMFVLNKKHVEPICDMMIERGLNLNIWAYARVDTVRDGMVEKLKKAGIHWLAFGIESANERVRDEARKGYDQEDIFETLNKVWDAGIHVIGNYIFGLPEDDLKSMQETLDLAMELNCEFGNFYAAMAYPGSQLYKTALQEKWPLPEKWSGYSQHAEDSLPLPTKHLSASEVLRFRDHAFHAYFQNPKYLDMVSRKFGSAAVEHIHSMAAHKLVRRFA